MNAKRILLLSAYDAQSHRYWHQQLVSQFPQHQWQVLTLKDRHFAWRMGGNAISFKAQYDSALKAEYDVLLATSMTDLSTVLGLYPNLAKLPKHLYFHENQFAYPVNKQQKGLLEIQIRSIYAAVVADFLWFNSVYNRDTFLTGVEKLTEKMPDGIPTNLVHSLRQKSSILPVPVADDCHQLTHENPSSKELQVVWNHRWEHDKGPETLLETLRLCVDKSHIKFHIIGQQFRTTPPALQEIIEHHSTQCLNIGYIESRTDYIEILQQSDVVLSTALHEFQGLAVSEAVACGCTPIMPDRLVYPELYPASNLYQSTPDQPKQEAKNIINLLINQDSLASGPDNYHQQNLHENYESMIETNK